MCSRIRRRARLALVFVSFATVIGAGTVLGRAVDGDDIAAMNGWLVERPAAADPGERERVRSHMPGDCRDLNASFLDPACHSSELRKRHPGHSVHRLATIVIGRAKARDGESE